MAVDMNVPSLNGGDFLRSLGLDPEQVEDGSVQVDIRHGLPAIVRWEGFLIISPEQLTEALEAAKR